jgi:hypothetical protein
VATVLPPDVSVVLTLDESLNVEDLLTEVTAITLTSVTEPYILVLTID